MSRWDPADHPRDPRDGRFIDRLKLAGRIALDPGQRLIASSTTTNSGPNDVVMAVVTGPDRPEIRLGVVNHEDTRRWSAANRGGTARLDLEGATHLLRVLDEAEAAGEQYQRGYQQTADRLDTETEELRHRGLVSDQQQLRRIQERLDQIVLEYPEPDPVLVGGAVDGIGWGDVVWQVDGVDDAEGGWGLSLAVRPTGVADWSMDAAMGDEQEASMRKPDLRRFRRALETAVAAAGGWAQRVSDQMGRRQG
jgi:hypothetical protein